MRKFLLCGCFLLSLVTVRSQRGIPSRGWTEVLPGVWKTVVGQPDSVDFLSAAGVLPAAHALDSLGHTSFPLDSSEVMLSASGNRTSLHFPLDTLERIFGLGLNFKTVDQRGRIMRLHVDHYGGEDNGRTHAPVPFFVSSNGYGVFVNSARYIDAWVGTATRKDARHPAKVYDRNTDSRWQGNPYSDNIEMSVPAAGAEVYIIGGPTLMKVVQRFNLLCGGGFIPPKWGLGFWYRTPSLYTAAQVTAEADSFRTMGYPLSVIGLEPGWQSRSYPCTYEWDPTRFAQPDSFLHQMAIRGIHTNLWINGYLAPGSTLGKQIKPYSASHTVWNGYVPDYLVDSTVSILGAHFRSNLLNRGVSGFKMDENDGFDTWLWPDVAQFPSGVSAEQQRQLYGLLMQKTTSALFHEANRRSYGLVRASNAGASSFPYVIYNDYYSHRDFITAMINSSFCGVQWTPEVRSSASGEEWIRRMQTVCFSPLAMINAWQDGTKPWSFPELKEQVKETMLLRMRLIPYLYSCFAHYHFAGKPPVRSLNLIDGFMDAGASQDSAYRAAISSEVRDAFMLGDDLLVAPLFEGEKTRKVVLPRGNWYDFYTGKYVGNGEVITVTGKLSEIPVFAREGAIIPLMSPLLQVPARGSKSDLEILVFGKAVGSDRLLYDDDGDSFDYERGQYSWRTMSVRKNNKGRREGRLSAAEKGKPDMIGKVRWKFMTE